MPNIPITGMPDSYRVPGGYAEILFAQGAASAALAGREVVIAMPKLASGTAVAGTLYAIGNEATAITLAGAGSPAHRACRRFLKCNKTQKLWLLGCDGSTGAGLTSATGTLTFTNVATGTGVATATICGEECSISIASGDAVAAMASAMVLAVNARTHLPVTASAPGGGVVTLTAKLGGLSQGDNTTATIRIRATITAGIATTFVAASAGVGLAPGVAGVDGAVTEPANLATALAALDAVRKYYIVTSNPIATSLTNLQTHVSNKSEPRPGLRSVGICAFNGALAACQTLATARNYERLWLMWQRNSDDDPASIAANVAAVASKKFDVNPVYNFDSYTGSDWLVPPAFAVADWPDDDDLNDAINDGITPIASTTGASSIVMLCSTRSKTVAGGTIDDFRATEAHRISGADYHVDQLLQTYALRYSGKSLASDKLLSDGTVDPNQRLASGVVTPATFKPWIRQIIRDDESKGVLQDADASIESLRVERDPANSGRLECGHDLHIVDLLHQATFRVAEISEG